MVSNAVSGDSGLPTIVTVQALTRSIVCETANSVSRLSELDRDIIRLNYVHVSGEEFGPRQADMCAK